MERTEFLARLRRRLDRSAPVLGAHPPIPASGVAEASYLRDLSDPAAAFVEEATARGAVVRRITPGSVDTLIAEVVAAEGIRSAVISRDPETDGVPAALRAAGVEVLDWDGAPTASRADLGVTGAIAALAMPGTIVVDAARAGGRTASLLPPVHLALVTADRLLAHTAALWRHMHRHFPEGPPSQVVTITGPSKTGDIELVLTTGVHGPKRLWIGLIEQ